MKITLAKNAGYCFGVSQAIETVERCADESREPIHTLGPLIHNNQVIEKLNQKQVYVANEVEEVSDGTIAIRSHGVGADKIREIEKKGLNYIDATCPYVKKIHQKVKKYYEEGYEIFIIGDHKHPEVIGINGWCNYEGIVFQSKNSVPFREKYDKICVVAQTTMNREKFEEIAREISTRYPNAIILDTICNATRKRQSETKELASQSDCMVIIGGFHSSNTRKLAEISEQYCSNTIHIEKAEQLDTDQLSECENIGVTAGASTPDWIIKEVITKMTKSFEEALKNSEMEASYEETFKNLSKGSIVTGKVISIEKDCAFLNINYKSDAKLTKNEYTSEDVDLNDVLQLDDEIEVMITDLNDGDGFVLVSKRKLKNKKAMEELQKAYEEEKILEGTVKKTVKGGLIVKLEEGEVFMPASQYHIRYVKDLESLVDKNVRGKIIEFDKRKNRVIFSQKVVLEKEQKEKQAKLREEKKELIESLEVGQEVEGPIKTITNFGIFVRLGALDGFVHISDLSWKNVKHPQDLFQVGDEVKAKIIEINEEENKIKMSLKDLMEEPWVTFEKSHSVGDEIEVEITRIAPFGAFAKIIEDVEGLIHISELAHEKVEKVENVVNPGDQIKVKIIGINKEERKIALSIKETIVQEKPAKKKVELTKPSEPENQTVYEEESDNTIGNLLGDLFKNDEEDDKE